MLSWQTILLLTSVYFLCEENNGQLVLIAQGENLEGLLLAL